MKEHEARQMCRSCYQKFLWRNSPNYAKNKAERQAKYRKANLEKYNDYQKEYIKGLRKLKREHKNMIDEAYLEGFKDAKLLYKSSLLDKFIRKMQIYFAGSGKRNDTSN